MYHLSPFKMGSNNQVVTADEEKQNKAVASEAGHELGTTHNNIDVIHVSHERPYSETNFIGTYIAICLGALACYGGFVMPATSLAQINAAIGNELTYPRFLSLTIMQDPLLVTIG